jgi:hypothetical protein
VGTTILGSQTVSAKGELVYTDEDDNDIQITTGGKINTAALKSAAVADISNLLELIYPIGYVITLGVSTNPGTLLGVGTWTAIEGRVIVGKAAAGTFDTLNEELGAETVDASHTHTGTTDGASAGGAGAITLNSALVQHVHTFTTGSGGSATQSTLQPSITKYVWERVS